jgi:hypothetical protein
MTGTRQASSSSTRGRKLIASLVVIVTVIGAWKFIDYRIQPPAPPKAVTSDM